MIILKRRCFFAFMHHKTQLAVTIDYSTQALCKAKELQTNC